MVVEAGAGVAADGDGGGGGGGGPLLGEIGRTLGSKEREEERKKNGRFRRRRDPKQTGHSLHPVAFIPSLSLSPSLVLAFFLPSFDGIAVRAAGRSTLLLTMRLLAAPERKVQVSPSLISSPSSFFSLRRSRRSGSGCQSCSFPPPSCW